MDLHLMALKALGAEIELEEGYVEARAPGGLKGAEITFPFVSVGATEHALLAAVLAEGTTVLNNAAREPDGFATTALRLSSYRKIEPGPLEEWMMFDHPSGRARVFMAMQWKAGQLELGAADQTPDLRVDRAEAIAAEMEAANAQ